ncbi:MFS general substrate transporter [Cryphonectria parasitica EP155]|uniref:MFS general substrate transporter n=1 Tax=Cryphonectria parasitica (strain ATCC 38755 / EP155) TaxID=660469 RepID=A0A9P4YBR1_CRYP1|nr:MFS general substrate transporter [Cryphonectria parasitica EP155]KAF3770428.1 MFS general substrate transporter [Cryphonectria parasitica EP155]
MANSTSSASLASAVTVTEADVQSHSSRESQVSHFKVVFDPAGVTKEALQWRYPGSGTEEDPFAVDFTPCDPFNPQGYTVKKKWAITILTAFSTLAVAFVSSAFSGGLTYIIEEFGVSEELSILGISLFVVGFAVGPLLWAPMSESFGRQGLYFVTYGAMVAFNAAAAGVPTFSGLVILRFFAGAFGSSPLTNSGGVIADMFSASDRGFATACFAAAPFLGPSLGPIVSGFLGEAEGWRWIEGVMAIFTGVLWIVCSALIPETYSPVLLRTRAAKLAKLTGKVYVSKLDLGKDRISLLRRLRISLSRPWTLLFREPIVFLVSIYMAIVYGTLYMMFPAFPIIFELDKHWSAGLSGLAFVGILVGMVFAIAYAMVDNIRYTKISKKLGGDVPPEARLPGAIVGSILLPVGLFWFAWTNGNNVHWVVPIIGSAFFATGLVLVFLSLMNYLIDSYVVFAASVLAANAVLRSLFGAAFPLFTDQMYTNLGIHWAASIPAFLSLVCIPFPIFFWKYGPHVRAKCKFAAEAARVLQEMRADNNLVIDESEAEEEVRDAERMQKLVNVAAAGAAGPASSSEKEKEVDMEPELPLEAPVVRDETEIEKPQEEV